MCTCCVGVFLFNWRGGMHAVESLFARCCEFFYQYLGVALELPWCRITTSLESWHHWCIAIELLLRSFHHHLIDAESHRSPYKNPILFSRSSLCSWQHVLPLTKILLHMYLFSYKPTLRGGLPLWNMLLQCFHLLCIIGKKEIVCKHSSWFHHKNLLPLLRNQLLHNLCKWCTVHNAY